MQRSQDRILTTHAGSLPRPRELVELMVRKSRREALAADELAAAVEAATNYVEHPEVVGERIERAAAAIGDPHRVLAGTDCGFDTSAGLGEVAEEVVWEKLRALRAGADLATRHLLG